MDRENLINIPIDLLNKGTTRIALRWCTGLGKSRAAIEVANLVCRDYTTKDILLIVAEVAHKDNWDKEIKKWGLKSCNLVVECYASLKKWRNSEWDLIIFDEAHHLASDLRTNILQSIKSKIVLLLSATLPDYTLELLSGIYGRFEVSTIKLGEAIESGILPKPSIYLIPLKLNKEDNTERIIEEWGNKGDRITIRCSYYDRWKYKRDKANFPHVKLEITCTQFQKYNYICEQLEYWKNRFFRGNQVFAKNKWLQYGSLRKRFLGECKTKVVKPVIENLKNKRLICFCSSIEQAKLLGGNHAIHSERRDSANTIELFNSHKISKLFAVGMLQEGQNLDSIEAGVIVQLDGNERAFVQKFGRTLRAKRPLQFIFYYKETRDEEYLNKALEDMNIEDIIEINMEDMKYVNYY